MNYVFKKFSVNIEYSIMLPHFLKTALSPYHYEVI